MSLFNTTLLIAGLILLGLIFVIVGIWVAVGILYPEPTESQNRIKKILSKKTNKSDAFSQWLEEQTDNDSGGKKRNSVLEKIAKKVGLTTLMTQAGVTIPVSKYMIMFMAVPFILGVYLIGLEDVPLLVSILVTISPTLSIIYLFYKKKKRYETLEQQLPDALNIMTGSLRAGHAFASSIALMAKEMIAPIQPIFQDLSNDLQLGLPANESLNKMTQEVKIPDYQIFATAVIVQRETGGNLAEIMDQLAVTIRERAKMKRQIGVLTSQTRLSAYIVACAPVIMYIILQVMMPGYTKALEDHPWGPAVFGACVFLNIAGFVVMRQIVNIRI